MAVAFDNVTMDEAVAQAVENLQSKRRCMVVTPDAEIAQSCVTDDRLREIVRKAGLVLPDGIGVIYASRILKKPLKQRVPGVEFGENLVSALRDTGKTIFFFGGKPGVAEEAAHRLQVKYPGLKVAGTKDGFSSGKRRRWKPCSRQSPMCCSSAWVPPNRSILWPTTLINWGPR